MVPSEDHEDPEDWSRLHASVMDPGARGTGTTAIAAQRWRRRLRRFASGSIVTVALALTVATAAAAAEDLVTASASSAPSEPQARARATVRPLSARVLELASRVQEARDQSLALGTLLEAAAGRAGEGTIAKPPAGAGGATPVEAPVTGTAGRGEEAIPLVPTTHESTVPQATPASRDGSAPVDASRPPAESLSTDVQVNSGGALHRVAHRARPTAGAAVTATYRAHAIERAAPAGGPRRSNSTPNYSPAPAVPPPGAPHGALSVPPYASASLIFAFVAALIGMATIERFRAPTTRAAPRRPRLLPAPVHSPLERPG